MSKDLELWQFIAVRLLRGENVMLLVVAESSGSSPGRQGYKMAVGADGELCGSIGGGLMEVNLVENSRKFLSEPGARGVPGASPSGVQVATGLQKSARSNGDTAMLGSSEQVHRKDVPNASGMICSGKQTVIFKLLDPSNLKTVRQIIDALKSRSPDRLTISPSLFSMGSPEPETPDFRFEKHSETDYSYEETLGYKNVLHIIGGGHCALALCELMSKIDFHISIFDDRPDLNTLQKNEFADEIEIIASYDRIAEHIPSSHTAYVVVMTLGFKSDAVVIRSLIEKEFKYFGVLGSKAKMATLMKELENEGLSAEKLSRIHTPIGLPINSRTPEEIAVSIAAEIIAVKNS